MYVVGNQKNCLNETVLLSTPKNVITDGLENINILGSKFVFIQTYDNSVIAQTNCNFCKYRIRIKYVCFCCFTSHVNSYGHCGTVSSLNHTFSWAGLSKRLNSNLCTYFRL